MFGKEENIEKRLKKAFWEALDDSPFVMLGIKGVENSLTRPMTAQVDKSEDAEDENGGQIYFFASKTDGVGDSVGKGCEAVATYASKGHDLFADIQGTLTPSNDREVIERLWNPIIASWYKDGKDDPDLLLLRFDARSADIWEASAAATLKAAAMKMLFDVDPGKEHQDDHRTKVNL